MEALLHKRMHQSRHPLHRNLFKSFLRSLPVYGIDHYLPRMQLPYYVRPCLDTVFCLGIESGTFQEHGLEDEVSIEPLQAADHTIQRIWT